MIEFLWLLLSLFIGACVSAALVATALYHLGLFKSEGLAPKHWTPFK